MTLSNSDVVANVHLNDLLRSGRFVAGKHVHSNDRECLADPDSRLRLSPLLLDKEREGRRKERPMWLLSIGVSRQVQIANH